MKRIILLTAALAIFITTANAQNEYRISQSIPDSINTINIPAGWQVRLIQAEEASVTIVTPCQIFFDEANEPEVCTIDGRALTILKNKEMPKSTILEVAVSGDIVYLDIDNNATVETSDLHFQRKATVSIGDSAKVRGTYWSGSGSLKVKLHYDAALQLDSIDAAGELRVNCPAGANFTCPSLKSPNTLVNKDRNSTGTLLATDTARHLEIRNTNNNWRRHFNNLTLSFGFTAPVTLYTNNKSGSPYNHGNQYRISMLVSCMDRIPITEKLSFKSFLTYELDWNHLLNSVVPSGNGLALNAVASGEIPVQHLYGEYLGLSMQLHYSFGKANERAGFKAWGITFGVDLLRNTSAQLVTRTMGTDNRWIKTTNDVNPFNPWQIRANLAVGGGPLTGATLGFTFDLLPTYRKNIGADNIHTFGITLSF